MTGNNSNPNEGKPAPGVWSNAGFHRVLSSLGWRLPETEDEIAEAEEWVEKHPPIVSPEIADPSRALARPRGKSSPLNLIPLEAEGVIKENLARAAREGSGIPPNIEERMRKDREAAERDREQE